MTNRYDHRRGKTDPPRKNDFRSNKKHRILKRRRFALSVLVLLILIITGAIGIYSISTHIMDNYDDAEEFNEFVTDHRDAAELPQCFSSNTDKIQYGDKLSTAVRLPKTRNAAVNNAMSAMSASMISGFEKKYAKSEKAALMVDYEGYMTDDVYGIAVHKDIFEEKDDEMVIVDSQVFTRSFVKKSGRETGGTALLKDGYKDQLSQDILDALTDEYGDNLSSHAKEHVSDTSENLNSFLLADSGAIFYFDEGTVLKKGMGSASVILDMSVIEDFLQDDPADAPVDKNKPMVAITYDDGLNGPLEEELLDCLEENGAVATFFLLGTNVANVSDSENILKRMLKQGCEIGNHSYSHPQLTKLSPKAIREQADKTNDLIEKLSGEVPTLFRAPYGAKNDKVIKTYDMPEIGWSYDSLDWKYRDPKREFNDIKSAGNLDGEVLLFHSIHEPSVEASKLIIPYLRARGYQLVTVSELAEYRYGVTLENGRSYGPDFFDLEDSEKTPEISY